jgi:hypothetical protein
MSGGVFIEKTWFRQGFMPKPGKTDILSPARYTGRLFPLTFFKWGGNGEKKDCSFL